MSYPPPKIPAEQDYDEYRPSSRHDLFYDPPNAPRAASPPRRADVSKPYQSTNTTTTATTPDNDDHTTPYTPPIYSSKTALNPYDNTNPSSQPYPPYSPTPYQDNAYAKPAARDYPYAEAGYGNAPSPPPPRKRTLFSRLFNGDQRFAYFCWTVSIVQIAVFIGELVKNALATHSPIEVQPVFNPLIGPSSYVPPLPPKLSSFPCRICFGDYFWSMTNG